MVAVTVMGYMTGSCGHGHASTDCDYVMDFAIFWKQEETEREYKLDIGLLVVGGVKV
jgi:hypothetical protein